MWKKEKKVDSSPFTFKKSDGVNEGKRKREREKGWFITYSWNRVMSKYMNKRKKMEEKKDWFTFINERVMSLYIKRKKDSFTLIHENE